MATRRNPPLNPAEVQYEWPGDRTEERAGDADVGIEVEREESGLFLSFPDVPDWNEAGREFEFRPLMIFVGLTGSGGPVEFTFYQPGSVDSDEVFAKVSMDRQTGELTLSVQGNKATFARRTHYEDRTDWEFSRVPITWDKGPQMPGG